MLKKQKTHNPQNSYKNDFIETELYADYDLNVQKPKKNKKDREKNKRNARHQVEDHFAKKALMRKVVDWDDYLNS